MIGSGLYEEIPKRWNSSDRLSVRNLTKKYGKKLAVNDLSLTVFKDEILVLLGHNGAGKTTAISMLTGLERASKGKASINIEKEEIDLFAEDNNVADFISVCPQENVLCDKMTVFENINFFCRFKDVQDADDKISQNLKLFNLTEKKNTLAANLSGGQKRKL